MWMPKSPKVLGYDGCTKFGIVNLTFNLNDNSKRNSGVNPKINLKVNSNVNFECWMMSIRDSLWDNINLDATSRSNPDSLRDSTQGHDSDTSSRTFLRPKKSIDHVFTICKRTANEKHIPMTTISLPVTLNRNPIDASFAVLTFQLAPFTNYLNEMLFPYQLWWQTQRQF